MKYLNAKNDVLDWRPAVELQEEILCQLRDKAEYLAGEQAVALYEEMVRRISERIAGEEESQRKINQLLDRIGRSSIEDLVSLHRELSHLAAEHFRQHDSAAALLEICAEYRERLIRRVLYLAEQQMIDDKMGEPPVDFAWIEVGGAGRRELALRGEYKALVVYGRDGEETARWFEKYCLLCMDLLEATTVIRPGPISPAYPEYRRSITEWRAALTQQDGFSGQRLIGCLDMRHLHGAETVSSEFENLVYAVVQALPELIRQERRRTSRLPLATGLLGWFRVERTGIHRGEVNIQEYAYLPLVSTIRVMAAAADIHEPNTALRIRKLLIKGKLSVDMAENLLHAYHIINRQRIPLQLGEISTSGPGYVDPDYLTEEEEQTLKTALEAVSNLQKFLYATLALDR